jgi:predicted phosphoribosyltransferase
MRFRDRTDAGRKLATALAEYAGRSDVIVLGLPRGGVVVAAEVARTLAAPLDVCLVRKLGVPGYPELAMGAIASGGVQVLSDDLIRDLRITPAMVAKVAAAERGELERREVAYRGHRPPIAVRDRTIILVDDGLATGSTMEAAARAIRQQSPASVVIAVPVSSHEASERLTRVADRLVCLDTPYPFHAVGQWYDYFDQTTDAEVVELLEEAGDWAATGKEEGHR